MRLTPAQVLAHLAKGLAPIYVVAGEEPLLLQETLDALRAAARKAGYSEREVLDADRYFNWQQLADACASLSLFATRRIVEVRLPSGTPNDEGVKVLKTLAGHPSPDTLVILVCGALDTRQRGAGWYVALEEAGASVYCWPVKPAEFAAWLGGRVKAAGLQLEPEALKLLAERTEGNLLAAAQDLEKLKLLFPGEAVSAERLAEAVADSARFEAFDLNHRALSGDGEGSVRSLQRLREEGVAPLEILGALVWSLRQLAQATIAYGRTRDVQAACQAAGIQRFRIDPFLQAVPRCRPAEVMDWLRLSARIDHAVKTGQEAAAWEDLLTLVLAVSGTRKSRAV